jgi:hypothetical protein
MKKLLIALSIMVTTSTVYADDEGYEYEKMLHQAAMMKYISEEVVKNGTTAAKVTNDKGELMFGDDEVGYYETVEEYINMYDSSIRSPY